jgi:hypothetical protein
MKIVELSDHPGAMLEGLHSRQQAADKRASAHYRKALAQYEQQVRTQREKARAAQERALARHSALVRKRRRTRDRARAEHRWWAWLKASVLAWNTQHRRPPRPARLPVPPAPAPAVNQSRLTDQEEILTAGMTGELVVATELEKLLDDYWTLLRGYRNRRGEIDHILLGPRGMFAIEVKHRNATVYVDGEQWRYDKYDRYGNKVEQGWITDRQGRSPSAQLNQPAAELERFLSSRGHPVRARRAVILTHPRSALGGFRDLTVDLVATSTTDVAGLLAESPEALGKAEADQLRDLIIRDHKFHQRRPAR